MKLINLLLILLINPLSADYSSLSKNENTKVIKAFKQAKFYKYYESLATGTDTIEIIETEKIKVVSTGTGYIQTYKLLVVMNISDKKFKRNLVVDLEYNKDGSLGSVTILDQIKEYSIPVSLGFILGVLFQLLL